MNPEVKKHKEGSVRQMLSIAFPMLISNACETVIIFTDRLFVAKLDPHLLNASLMGGLSVFVSMTFFVGLTGYTTALAAQYLGSKQKSKCALVLTQAMIIAVIAYPLMLAARPLTHQLFGMMDISLQQLEPQILYFNLLSYIILFSLLRHCLSSFFAGIGRTRIVMLSSAVMMCCNVAFNYVLVFGKFGFPALGIQGAAYGSIMAAVAGLLILVIAYLRPKITQEFKVFEAFRFNPAIMKKLLRFGYPAGLEYFLNILAFTVMVAIFQSASPIIATAFTIVINWDIVSYVPLLGVEIGVTSLVGRYMGAGKPDIAHKSTMSGIKFGICYSAIVFLFFLLIPKELVSVFKPHDANALFEEAIPLAVTMLRLACLYVLIEAVLIAIVGALRGAGDTLWAMILTVSLHWALIPVLYLVLFIMKKPPEIAWFSVIMVFFFFLGLIILRYKKGDWKKLHILDEATS